MRDGYAWAGAAGEEECYAIPEGRAACANRWNDTALFPEARLIAVALALLLLSDLACYRLPAIGCLRLEPTDRNCLQPPARPECARIFDWYGDPFCAPFKNKMPASAEL